MYIEEVTIRMSASENPRLLRSLMRSRQVDAIDAFLALPDWQLVSEIQQSGRQTHLQTVFDVVQWAVDSDLEILLCGLGRTLELGSREPRWKVSHYM